MLKEEKHIFKKHTSFILFTVYKLQCQADNTHLPSDHLTMRALLSRVSFPSSSLLARHRIVFSTCGKKQDSLRWNV